MWENRFVIATQFATKVQLIDFEIICFALESHFTNYMKKVSFFVFSH